MNIYVLTFFFVSYINVSVMKYVSETILETLGQSNEIFIELKII